VFSQVSALKTLDFGDWEAYITLQDKDSASTSLLREAGGDNGVPFGVRRLERENPPWRLRPGAIHLVDETAQMFFLTSRIPEISILMDHSSGEIHQELRIESRQLLKQRETVCVWRFMQTA
jgi:hypothetical protein